MTSVPVTAPRPLKTIAGVEWHFFTAGQWSDEGWLGAIVRVEPPERATEQDVEAMKARILAAGAVAVRVLPWRRGQALGEQASAPVPEVTLGLREVVAQLVSSARTLDRDALAKAVEDTLSAEGL